MNKKLGLSIVGLVAVASIVGFAHSAPKSVSLITKNASATASTPVSTPEVKATTTPLVGTPPASTVTPAPASVSSTNQANSTTSVTSTAYDSQTANTGTSDTDLSNDNTYTNVDGESVHSPADSTDGAVPAGATAKCNDGTYSFSQHHSGTCSDHGGVATWL